MGLGRFGGVISAGKGRGRRKRVSQSAAVDEATWQAPGAEVFVPVNVAALDVFGGSVSGGEVVGCAATEQIKRANKEVVVPRMWSPHAPRRETGS